MRKYDGLRLIISWILIFLSMVLCTKSGETPEVNLHYILGFGGFGLASIVMLYWYYRTINSPSPNKKNKSDNNE